MLIPARAFPHRPGAGDAQRSRSMTQEPGPDHPTPWQRANLFRSLRVVSCMCACAMARTAVCTRAVCCMHGVHCAVCVPRRTCHVSGALGRRSRLSWLGAVWSGICIKQIRKCLDPRPGLQHITTRCAVPHTWKMRATHRHGQRQRATARRGGPRAARSKRDPHLYASDTAERSPSASRMAR